jgi:hypothetical protein
MAWRKRAPGCLGWVTSSCARDPVAYGKGVRVGLWVCGGGFQSAAQMFAATLFERAERQRMFMCDGRCKSCVV